MKTNITFKIWYAEIGRIIKNKLIQKKDIYGNWATLLIDDAYIFFCEII